MIKKKFCIAHNITKYDNLSQLPKKIMGHTPTKKDSPMVLVLKDGDATSCHAIGILDDIIYDSNCTHAVGITQKNLNLLSGTEYVGIHHGKQWTILPRTSIKKRKRGKGNRCSKKNKS